ncbi:LytTR family DNA-binding domain-containing protein [Parasphingopyxis sp.]|uniref:LytTR family DNA-binding domain-containing protein n=1 Tax=Parasphingopyxis sp. TaxID=1920299 RepID=UPI002611CEDD|nr:LytTR family DNA-binding domain-containing protein [Parasphingopyxis sp.]
MVLSAAETEGRFERRIMLYAMIAIALVGIAIAAVNALSDIADMRRTGLLVEPAQQWLTELTSVAAIVALAPFIVLLTGAWRLPDRGLPLWIAGHLAAAAIFSTLHIALMTGLRLALFPPILDRAYLPSESLAALFVYEFRKDLLTYAVIAASMTMFRMLMEQQRELEAARRDARESQLITLKCGGRTMRFDAAAFRHAKSAGNYVEVAAGDQTHFARATLAGVEGLLRDAGIDVARVHRSWLVNRDKIVESAPSGSGDLVLTLKGGETVPCSRRYRAAIEI